MNAENWIVVANLVLEYLKVLAWPGVVLSLALVFKDPVSDLLRKIKRIGFAGGTLDAEADEASSEVDAVSIKRPKATEVEQTASPAVASPPSAEAPPATGERQREPGTAQEPDDREAGSPKFSHHAEVGTSKKVVRTRDKLSVLMGLSGTDHRHDTLIDVQVYENLRQLALDSPTKAVREAYQGLRLNALRVLLQVRPDLNSTSKATLSGLFEAMGQEGLITDSAHEPASRLDWIYNSTRSAKDLSPNGALSFIDAAQKLDRLLLEINASSPSAMRQRLERAKRIVDDLVERWLLGDSVETSVGSGALHVEVPGSLIETDSDPLVADFLSRLQDVAADSRVMVVVHHDDGGRTFNRSKKMHP